MQDSFRGSFHLESAINSCMTIALSRTTRLTYNSGVKAYFTFTAMYTIPKVQYNIPLCTENILMYFVAHCQVTLKLSFATIKSYLAGIRHFYISHGVSNPFNGPGTDALQRLRIMLRGVKKCQLPTAPRRGPISGTMLQTLCQKLNIGLFGRYADKLMEAACLLAFFGFLRCGEFTTHSATFDPSSNLCLGDVVVNEISIIINIKVSKCDPFRKGHTIELFKNDTTVCPHRAITKFLNTRNLLNANPHAPLFLLDSGQPLSRIIFLKWLNIIGSEAGWDHTITGHSFRIGAATAAAAAHVPDHVIQLLGRWSSDCYQRYIRTPQLVMRNAQTNIAKYILTT